MLAVLASCGKQADTVKSESLRIGLLADPLASLLYLAQEKGMFQRRALEVSFQDHEGGFTPSGSCARRLEVAACTEYALAMQSFAGNDLRAIGTVATPTIRS